MELARDHSDDPTCKNGALRGKNVWRMVAATAQTVIWKVEKGGVRHSHNGGTQQLWVFLLKMIIFSGGFGGTTFLGNTHNITSVLFWKTIPRFFRENKSIRNLDCVGMIGMGANFTLW